MVLTLRLGVLYEYQNKQRRLPFVHLRWEVFNARYTLSHLKHEFHL
jgi:hypothetical protein